MATMVYFERIWAYDGTKIFATNKEDEFIWVNSFENGIVMVEPTLGTSISNYAELIAGCFEEESNFASEIISVFECESNTNFIGIQFVFNGVTILVTKENADKEKICKAYHEGLEAEAERRRVEFEAYKKTDEYRKKRAIQLKRAVRKETVQNDSISVGESTELLFKDEEAKKNWEQYVEVNSKDSYSYGVVTYAERWAKYMQHLMDKHNKNVAEIANNASCASDVEGITGYMYGCAVAVLASCWKYGDELRKWHNGKYGHEDTGGVVNPAVLTIEVN